jgi:filamentous hemagglutinin family protein
MHRRRASPRFRVRRLAVAAATLFVVGAAVAQARPPVVFASKLPPPAFNLPQPFTTLMRDPAQRGFATPVAGSGAVSWRVEGRTATLDQGTVEKVLLNWQSFDIGEGYTVRFIQDKDPTKLVSALNRVWGSQPSVIQGSLIADREVIVQNPLGVHFGSTARVRAGKFAATTLAVSDAVYARGIRNVTDGSAVFTTAGTDHAPTDLNSAVTLEPGAIVSTAAGGDVLLVAPRVVNQGRIETPQGQAVLAAGERVYLMSSSDPAQRGLIVAVDAVRNANGTPDAELGVVENGGAAAMLRQLNEIRAERGSINLVGLTLKQNGTLNATTAVRGANGSILLQAMASTGTLDSAPVNGAERRGLAIEPGAVVRVSAELGSVAFGAGSVTAVLPEAGGATQLDAERFNRSSVRAEGRHIAVADSARVSAPSGSIALLAARDASADRLFDTQGAPGQADGSSIIVAAGARIDAAGLRDVAVDGARNQGELRLFRIELADAPVQRDGPLYRSGVFFDLRDATRITLADVADAAAAVGRTAEERSTAGGSIRVQTNGALVLGDGATLDVSGGSTRYSATTIRNSLVAQDGRITTFRAGAPGSRVDELLAATQNTPDPGYTEGAAGGTLAVAGSQVALGGAELRGQVVQGERQRDGRSASAAPSRLEVAVGVTSFDDLGQLRLVQRRAPSPPAGAALRTGADLSLDTVAAGGFGQLVLRAAEVVQPGFGRLDLGVGGLLDIEARTIELDGAFGAAGGRLSLVTPGSSSGVGRDGDITLAAGTRLDAAGLWANESAAAAGTAGERQLNGGNVTLRAARSVVVGEGSVFDVSAGARLSAGGSVTTGRAGVVNLSVGTNPLQQQALQIDGLTLRAFDFGSGGRLNLGTPALTLGTGPAAGGFTLDDRFFSDAGFGEMTIAAGGDIRLVGGSTLAPRLANWQFAEGFRTAPSGPMSDAVVRAAPVDTALAEPQPVHLSLRGTRPLDAGGASISLERGSSILLDAGGRLELSATRGIDVQGGLVARGGTVRLATTGLRGSDTGEDANGFIADQAIRLGPEASIVVDGIARLRRDGSGGAPVQFSPGGAGAATPADERRVGSVLGGGSITLEAARGYVVAEAGSRLSLDGAVAHVNLPGLPTAVTLARAAGSLVVSTPEGFTLDGSVSARAPRDAAGRALADGGRLDLSLGVGGVRTGTNGSTPYPTGPRVVAVGPREGGDPGNGLGRVPASLLQGSGFDAVLLGAGDLLRFDVPLSLSLPLSLQLNAPAIAARPGVQVAIDAGHALLGDAVNVRRGLAPDTSAQPDASPQRDTTLRVAASTIEVVGHTGLQGFSSVVLSADGGAGELRFGATQPNFNALESLSRRLRFAGTLTLDAGLTYATTASRYSVEGDGDSRLVLTRAPAADGESALPPRSAFAALTLAAGEIEHGGNLHLPFGQVTLAAERRLTLAPGSRTRVGGDGATVLYGQTLNLTDWLLPGGDGFFGLARDKGITLSAAHVTTAPTAVLDAGGGGTVLASEFFPGVGGSRDYFQTAGLFAVLPDYAASRALGSDGALALSGAAGSPAAGEFVVTMPGSGLAPGRYAVLPARDALIGGRLPQGAFLVSRAADPGRSVLRAPIANDDGSVVVTGYLATPGSATVGTPGERFVVEAAATFNARSEIRLSDVSTLLADRAASQGTGVPPLPRDGGLVQLRIGDGAGDRWQAGIELAGRGGRAGALDVSAARIALVDTLAKAPSTGFAITAATLADSGAGSLLLGGLRSRNPVGGAAGEALLDTQALAVTVDLGAAGLTVDELLLAARGHVDLAAGTRIGASEAATGDDGPQRWSVPGDGALAIVGSKPLQWQRSAATLAAGELRIGAGSVLSGAQVGLDATQRADIDPGVRLAAGALTLAAPTLAVGAGPTTTPGAPPATTLSGTLLSSLRDSARLELRGYGSVDFFGEQRLGRADQDSLVLDAPALRGMAGAGGQTALVELAAASVTLRNSSGRLAPAGAAGQGSLVLRATPPLRQGQTGGLTLGSGETALAFAAAELRSTGDLVLAGGSGTAAGTLRAQDTLTLAAARLTATDGAEHTLRAEGALRIVAEAGGRTLGERVGLGATVALQGASVQQGSVIELPGGRLAIASHGSDAGATAVRFDAGSRTSVAAAALTAPGGFTAASGAGAIEVRAASGAIELAGTLDASAAGAGDGGSVALHAFGPGGALRLPGGRLLGAAGGEGGDRGGRLTVDVSGMTSADELARAAAAGGVSGGFALRVRSGDLALGESLRAEHITIAADSGRLDIAGARLDATAPAGGVVQLSAGGDLRLAADAVIDARSTRDGAAGGDVLLASSSGRITVASGAAIDARGSRAAGGRIVLRAARDGSAAAVAIDPLDAGRMRAGEVALEGVRVYDGIDRLTTGSDAGSGALTLARLRADNAEFLAGRGAALAALGVGADDVLSRRVDLRAGAEVRSSGDLVLAADWAFAGDAGFLTLRAAGDLRLDASLSDGFASAQRNAALREDLRSGSYRLVAGADLTASNPLAVATAGGTPGGDLVVGTGRLVRTGAGSIEMAAARDLLWDAGSGSAGSVYVAGRPIAGLAALQDGLFAGQVARPTFTEGGGRLTLDAGRDIRAPEAEQFLVNWFWRSGSVNLASNGDASYASGSQLGWWSEFGRFGQSLGSFGGGSVRVDAGRDVLNLQAMVPTAGWADSRDVARAQIERRGGGDLDVYAGRDLRGGQFFLAGGRGRLDAGGAIGGVDSNTLAPLPLLALMDGEWRTRARGGVALHAPFNPTAAPAWANENRAGRSGFFYTYGSAAGLSVVSNSGGVDLRAGLTEAQAQGFELATFNPSELGALQVLPPTLRLTAAAGGIDILGGDATTAVLFPSAAGRLAWWAAGDLRLGGDSLARLAMSDSAAWPGPAQATALRNDPVTDSTVGLYAQTLDDLLPLTTLHAGDEAPARIHAGGSLSLRGQSPLFRSLLLPMPAQLSAGADVLELSLRTQHFDADDRTAVRAGRNVLAPLNGGIEVAGPGAFELSAGRNIDLGASSGVRTSGNQRNPALPAQGASIRLVAATAGVLDIDTLVTRWLSPAEQGGSASFERWRALLRDEVQAVLKTGPLGFEDALAAFRAFTPEAQGAFGRRLLDAAFAATYLERDPPDATAVREGLRAGFERRKAELLAAGDAALVAGGALELPGRETLRGDELGAYLDGLRRLGFNSLDLDSTIAARVAALAALAAQRQRPLAEFRQLVLQSEAASTGAAASNFGLLSLPMRLALFDQGFEAAELAGAGSFVPTLAWPGPQPLLAYRGTLDMTQSSVVTERGGDIAVVNAGGAINVGLKDAAAAGRAASGVIALGGGDVFGFSRGDFQVNTQRVFIVGAGDMTIWSSSGDIDSGRGANTAVAAPPLAARRSADGVVFEVPATTTGSGLGILADAQGRRSGRIGLYPALGEILALDAFIRAPQLVLGSTVRGADNLIAGAVGGAAAVPAAPPVAVAPPAASNDTRTTAVAAGSAAAEARPRNALLTVELLGLGTENETCEPRQRDRDGRCPPAAPPAQAPAGPADSKP